MGELLLAKIAMFLLHTLIFQVYLQPAYKIVFQKQIHIKIQHQLLITHVEFVQIQ